MKTKIDWSNAQTAFRQAFTAFAQNSRRDARKIAVQQIGLAMKNILLVTPPMGGKGVTSFAVGKRKGEVRIIRDTLRTFALVNPKEIRGIRKGSPAWAKLNAFYGFRGLTAEQNLKASENELLAFHLANRKANKRARATIKRPILKTKLERLRKTLLSRQGWGPSGWLEAAGKLKVSGIPGWVKRWASGNKGVGKVTELESGLEFLAINPTDFDRSVQTRVDAALRMQASNMIKQVHENMRKRSKL